MATTDEIRRRVHEADTARSARRAEAAQQVCELARRRAVIVEQLADVDRQLGDVLAAAREVMDLDELGAFTDLPAADLRRWLEARTTSTRGKRKKHATGAAGGKSTTRRTAAAAPASTSSSRSVEPALSRADEPVRAMAGDRKSVV